MAFATTPAAGAAQVCYRCRPSHTVSGPNATPCRRRQTADDLPIHRSPKGLIVSGEPDRPSIDVHQVLIEADLRRNGRDH